VVDRFGSASRGNAGCVRQGEGREPTDQLMELPEDNLPESEWHPDPHRVLIGSVNERGAIL